MQQHTLAKPGCYGSPMCYSAHTVLCKTCVFGKECASDAKARSERLVKKYGIAELLAVKHRKHSLREEVQTKTVVQQPVTIAPVTVPTTTPDALLEKVTINTIKGLLDKGINLRDMVADRINLIEEDSFIKIAVDCLLSGGCTRADLITAFIDKFSWGENTAITFANIAVRVLVRTGSAHRENTNWALMPCEPREEAFA